MGIRSATIVGEDRIRYAVEPACCLTSMDQVTVRANGRPVALAKLSSLGRRSGVGVVTTREPLDLTAACAVAIDGCGERTAVPTAVFDSAAFQRKYTYDGDDLGTVIHDDHTTFKVWAPTASKVVLNLFEAGDGGKALATVDMVRGMQGVWSVDYPCGHGTYYTYTVTTAVGTQEAVDPYARALGVNGDRGMVLDSAATDPAGFREEVFDTGLSSYGDAVIWEVHVRDFSNRIAAARYPGKYLAFTERGLTNGAGLPVGLDHVKALGVTHVHLQPIFDYATVDETVCAGFNWGYDPKNYNAPEGSYATDPFHGEVRVRECKQMVQALHESGLAVVMDVVYNHTYARDASFERIVPGYYYRRTDDGEFTNGSGCGNETASERKMVRKFMVDSVTYWQREYHIDGFRFDLMGLHDLTTMQAIEKAVHRIDPRAILYGEGWTGGATPLSYGRQADRANIHRIKASRGAVGAMAVFNDVMRDGLKGSVFEAGARGWISGNATDDTARRVLFGLTGGAQRGPGWQADPGRLVNYMSSHDNRTLWDILKLAAPRTGVKKRMAMQRLGAALVLLGRGIPFLLAGEEMLRTKGGCDNSYNAPDEVNNLDWEALTPDSDAYAMTRTYGQLIAIRKANPWLHTADARGEVLPGSAVAVTYTEKDRLVGCLVANPNDRSMGYVLPEGAWTALYGAAGDHSGSLTVPAKAVILLKKK